MTGADAPRDALRNQRGAVLLLLLLSVVVGISYALLNGLRHGRQERAQETAAVLAQAKEGLTGAAVTDSAMPGSLPCPDTNDDGLAEALSAGACPSYLGRLPWRTLGLPDLTDSSGERLWYALSPSFRKALAAQPITSATQGMITLRDSTGAIVNLGSATSAAVAVVIAPGPALLRQDGTVQNRTPANRNTPIHYLDNGNGEDNASFAAGTADGFIQGGIVNGATGQTVANDRLLGLSHAAFFSVVGKIVP